MRQGMVVACAVLTVGWSLPSFAQDVDTEMGPPAARKAQTTQSYGDLPGGDGRRTLSAFPKNLGRNFVGVFSRESLAPLLVGAAATASSSFIDHSASTSLSGSCTACGSTGATLGGSAIVPVVGALFVAGRFAPQGQFRAASYDFAQAMIVNAAYTGILKYSVQRERPDGSDNLSFPSGHTSTMFALASVASHHYGWKVGIPAYFAASAVGLSRIESNKHYLSDVIAGATLGLIVGRTVTRRDGEAPARRSRIAIAPATDAHGGGVGVSLSMAW